MGQGLVNKPLRCHPCCRADAPARFRASDNARSPDNGRSPRRSYSGGTPFRLALVKSIHKALACRDPTARGSLGGSVSLLLVFVIGLFSMVTVYSYFPALSSAF